MIAVLQRVSSAAVTADGVLSGRIGPGLLILLGVEKDDTPQDAECLCAKILSCRIFSDASGKMNFSLRDMNGELMVVSNFTLLGNCRRGNRPDFLAAENPEKAEQLYHQFVSLAKANLPRVATGRFGADMQIEMTADGPVTLIINSRTLNPRKRDMT